MGVNIFTGLGQTAWVNASVIHDSPISCYCWAAAALLDRRCLACLTLCTHLSTYTPQGPLCSRMFPCLPAHQGLHSVAAATSAAEAENADSSFLVPLLLPSWAYCKVAAGSTKTNNQA